MTECSLCQCHPCALSLADVGMPCGRPLLASAAQKHDFPSVSTRNMAQDTAPQSSFECRVHEDGKPKAGAGCPQRVAFKDSQCAVRR